ncbi:MAG: rRNA pseudouridine synthase [Betaproteobacteria bacterium]
MTESVRLAKRLAEMVSCSRREAELYIEGGWVTVDGIVVQEPQFRVSRQVVALHPEATLTAVQPITILYHQPPALAAENTPAALPGFAMDNHAADDPSGIRPLKRHLTRLTLTLPLEAAASGMQVFTQDWRVVRKLVEDAATVEQEYVVDVTGDPGPHGLKRLNHGLRFNGRALPPAKVSWQSETRLRFAVKGAQPGQIAHMCQSVGLQAQSLKRIRIGRISMARLPPGEWRYLPADERF